jgi:hypothetical protein
MAAREHGAMRLQQGYTVAMVIEERVFCSTAFLELCNET